MALSHQRKQLRAVLGALQEQGNSRQKKEELWLSRQQQPGLCLQWLCQQDQGRDQPPALSTDEDTP